MSCSTTPRTRARSSARAHSPAPAAMPRSISSKYRPRCSFRPATGSPISPCQCAFRRVTSVTCHRGWSPTSACSARRRANSPRSRSGPAGTYRITTTRNWPRHCANSAARFRSLPDDFLLNETETRMDRRTFLALSVGTAASAALVGAPPAHAGNAGGISWPTGQVLPRFATPARLTVCDITALSANEQLLAISLQGLVNRVRPEIYLLNTAGEGAATWLPSVGVPYGSPVDMGTLIASYRDQARGAVVWDPGLPATVNLATTLAGLDNLVVTSAEVAAQYGFTVVTDLRGRFTDELQAYQWAGQELWPRTAKRMVVNLNTTITGYLRDYAVANAALTVWLDHSNSDHLALIEQLATELPFNAPWIGWLRGGESPTVETLSNREVHVLAADRMTNLTVHSGASAYVNRTPYRAPASTFENKVYVTVTYSDGDNLQYAQHRMRISWDDPARGSVPINW